MCILLKTLKIERGKRLETILYFIIRLHPLSLSNNMTVICILLTEKGLVEANTWSSRRHIGITTLAMHMSMQHWPLTHTQKRSQNLIKVGKLCKYVLKIVTVCLLQYKTKTTVNMKKAITMSVTCPGMNLLFGALFEVKPLRGKKDSCCDDVNIKDKLTLI